MFFILIFVVIILLFGVAIPQETEKQNKMLDKHKKIMEGDDSFRPTKCIKSDRSNIALYIDKDRKKLRFVDLSGIGQATYNFNEIIECFIVDDGATIVSAIALMSPTKPVSLSLSVRIVTSRISNSLYEVPLITSSTKRDSKEYKRKNKVCTRNICNNGEHHKFKQTSIKA